MAPKVEACEQSEVEAQAESCELWVVPSNPWTELQILTHSLNKEQCPRGCMPERHKEEDISSLAPLLSSSVCPSTQWFP